MSLLKPKIKRNTWSQRKRAKLFGLLPKELQNGGVKSQAHLARIARRKVSRIHRKQQEEAAAYAASQAKVALASPV